MDDLSNLKTHEDCRDSILYQIFSDASPSNKDITHVTSIRSFIYARRHIFNITDPLDHEYNSADYDFLYEELEPVLKIFEVMPPSQLKLNYLKALIVMCRNIDIEPSGEFLRNIYQKEQYKYKQIRSQKKGYVTEKEKLMKTTDKELNTLLNFYKVKFIESDAALTDVLSTNQLMDLQNYAIFLLYLTMPPRRNIYYSVKVAFSTSILNTKQNYLIIKPDGDLYFKFNIQKSKHASFKGQNVPISSEAKPILKLLIQHLRSDYLFINKSGYPYSSNSFGLHLQRKTMAAIGVSLGSTAFRKNFVSDPEFKKLYLKKQKEAQLMGHSFDTAIGSYNVF